MTSVAPVVMHENEIFNDDTVLLVHNLKLYLKFLVIKLSTKRTLHFIIDSLTEEARAKEIQHVGRTHGLT